MLKRKYKIIKKVFSSNSSINKVNIEKHIQNPVKIEKVEGKGFNNFDIVYYINLDYRKDRMEQILKELKKTNIDEDKINRIEAVNIPGFGQLGCTKSHILALENFLKTPPEIKNCLILEDDFEFSLDQSTVNNLINYFFKNFENIYSVLMLSANIDKSFESKLNSIILRICKARTTSGYCVNKTYASILLNNYKNSAILLEKTRLIHTYALDTHVEHLQSKDFWYCFNPKIGKQRASYSDIEKKFMAYNC